MIITAPSLTDQGKNLLIRGIGGEQITFTRFKAGSGRLNGENPDMLTDLIEPVLAFSIIDMDDTQERILALTGRFDSSDVETAFAWRELGIFARGEDDVEILYAYANDGENASIVQKISTDVMTTQTVTMIIAIGEAQNVTAVYSPAKMYALKEDLDNHTDNRNNPHGVTKSQIGLGNVPNLSPSNMTVSFAEAQTRENIASGEKLSMMFSKIKKVITDVIGHLTETNNPHQVTRQQVGAAAETHTHKPADIVVEENDDALPLTAGGTGVKTLQALKDLIGTNAVMGIYEGNGAQKRGINLGFLPGAVLVYDEYGRTYDSADGVTGGMAVGVYGVRSRDSTSATHATVWDDQYTALLRGEDAGSSFAGFYVNYYVGTGAGSNISTNKNGVVYHYIAFR